jgi:hypothetical protein
MASAAGQIGRRIDIAQNPAVCHRQQLQQRARMTRE